MLPHLPPLPLSKLGVSVFKCPEGLRWQNRLFQQLTSKAPVLIHSFHSLRRALKYELNVAPTSLFKLNQVLVKSYTTSIPTTSPYFAFIISRQSSSSLVNFKDQTFVHSDPFADRSPYISTFSRSYSTNRKREGINSKQISSQVSLPDSATSASSKPLLSPPLSTSSSDIKYESMDCDCGKVVPPVPTDSAARTSDHHDPPLITEQKSLSKLPLLPKNRLIKEQLLASSTGMFNRMGIRIKWLLTKQVRPFNIDDISAFFSWIIVGNVIWILLGTTTFASLILFLMNTVFAQEYIAKVVGNLVTDQSGLRVSFEHAIVPKWSDGVISFRKVFVSRRPGNKKNKNRVTKESQAAAAAALVSKSDNSPEPDMKDLQQNQDDNDGPEDDGNYTQFDLTIQQVNVTLSFSRWMNGKGILNDVEVKGLRGVVDRRHVHWEPNDDPRKYKNVHSPGDFEIENFKMEDALFTLYQPDGFRPFNVSIFNCDLPQFRKNWLFYDLLSANNMSGSYDNSLFTIHPRQVHGTASFSEDSSNDNSSWTKITRLRVDGVNIEHLNTGIEGPFSWISSGNVDMIADVMIPSDTDDFTISTVVQDIVERWETNLLNRHHNRDDTLKRNNLPDKSARSENDRAKENIYRDNLRGSHPKNNDHDGVSDNHLNHYLLRHDNNHYEFPMDIAKDKQELQKYIVVDLKVQLNNARAMVPIFSSDLTYINSALIRPIVAYINSNNTYIPINCRVVKKLEDFEGSWTMYDSGLMDDISAEVYEAFAQNVYDDEARNRRMKKVGFWSLQLAVQILLISLGTFG
ncbi:hypothetical protein NADFUDRAFT_45996 [Nadsonia fulvescens var. elongata DSM 6958]|uniref:Mitochondrial distribution and morphology protein family 31/32 n=1 Tax=Nadsonia fulvescens var. elongata DSM 6958 TaxID=857566 RepID=A0A1E3PM90_9ASCO|nr:hypothetical protein NADFUDRAFT_45996 [Nadsonia fulvescens var. elongata DSM 6958]